MKNTYWIPFLCLTGLFLFIFSDSMAYVISYHEQQELFLFSRPYLEKYIYEIGGAGRYISNFITQFFYFPFAGKLIFSLLLSSLYLLPGLTYRKLTGKEDPLHIALLMPLHLLIQFKSLLLFSYIISSFFFRKETFLLYLTPFFINNRLLSGIFIPSPVCLHPLRHGIISSVFNTLSYQ